MTSRVSLHAQAVTHIAQRLRRRGISALRMPRRPGHDGDLLVAGQTCVAVRVVHPIRRPVVIRTQGKTYRYAYRTAGWCFHIHGRRAPHPPQVWALVTISGHALRCFVVPQSLIGDRLTLNVSWRRLQPGGRRHWLARHENAWDAVRVVANRRAA